MASAFLALPALAESGQTPSLEDIAAKMNSLSKNSEFISDAEYKKQMENLAKQESLAKRRAKLRELIGPTEAEKEEKAQEQKPEKTLQEKLNPGPDAKEVSIEFYDMMEEKYQKHLFELRQEIDSLKERIISLKSPSNKEVIQDHIYVTEVFSFGENRYAKIYHNFRTDEMSEGEEIVPGVVIKTIDDHGIIIEKSDGSTHRISKTSKSHAVKKAYSDSSDRELEYLNIRNQAQSPSDIDISPDMEGAIVPGINAPGFGGMGGMPTGF